LWHAHPTRDARSAWHRPVQGGGRATGRPALALWVAAAVLGTLLAVAGLTTIPALIGARTPAPQILQSETA